MRGASHFIPQFLKIGVKLIYNVVLVSGIQQYDSVLYIYIYIYIYKNIYIYIYKYI